MSLLLLVALEVQSLEVLHAIHHTMAPLAGQSTQRPWHRAHPLAAGPWLGGLLALHAPPSSEMRPVTSSPANGPGVVFHFHLLSIHLVLLGGWFLGVVFPFPPRFPFPSFLSSSLLLLFLVAVSPAPAPPRSSTSRVRSPCPLRFGRPLGVAEDLCGCQVSISSVGPTKQTNANETPPGPADPWPCARASTEPRLLDAEPRRRRRDRTGQTEIHSRP